MHDDERPRGRGPRRRTHAVRACRRLCAAVLLAGTLPVAAHAAPAPQPYGTNDATGFRDILPPGTNGRTNLLELATFRALGTRPSHNDDQLAMYRDLAFAAPRLTAEDLPRFFKDATFGVRPGEAERTYAPREDVTIVRDRAFGVPHIYGADRDGAMFGIGYATAEDRLFLIDVLRHYGRAQLSSFVGGSEGNRLSDEEQWRAAPYTEADLQQQIDRALVSYGPLGRIVQTDAENYVAGINAYIAQARLNPALMPGEYAAINRPQGPENFKLTDLIATASLVGGLFGKGGGDELRSALARQAFQARFGARTGERRWRDFRSEDDPEAPTIVRGRRFPALPRPARPKGVAIPDPRTYRAEPVVVGGQGGAQRSAAPATGTMVGVFQGRAATFPAKASNFALLSARKSASGRPIAVMGPQVGYFAPQILIEQDVHAPAVDGKPGIDARGVAFAGINLYVQLGRGRDYAWSATSAGNDIIDTFAMPLCDPGGGAARLDSGGYVFRGRCEPFEVLDRRSSWQPSLADSTPAGTQTLRALRTKLGIVEGRALVRGRPTVFTKLRTTYKHEIDNAAAGFLAFNTPEMIRGPRDFQRAASNIGFTFNWAYADARHIAYFNSADTPVRHPKADPRFPVDGRYTWRRYDPDTNTMQLTPPAAQPQVVDQDLLTSWNGKQAPGYRATDGNYGYGPVDRVQTLNRRIRAALRPTGKLSLAQLVGIVEDAATVDLRGQEVLPWLLRVIALDRAQSPAVRDAVAALAAWQRSGAHRRDLDRDGRYDAARAVALMDAWWPALLDAVFKPALGEDAFAALGAVQPQHDSPHAHDGSAFAGGWYGFVQKDLRTLLASTRATRGRVQGRWSRTYCGGTLRRPGSRARCAKVLTASLQRALPLADDPAKLYPGPDCTPGDQVCWDEVRFRAIGAITQPALAWTNRPTYQQIVEIPRRVPREAGFPFVYPARGR